jgi:hypothetical protein
MQHLALVALVVVVVVFVIVVTVAWYRESKRDKAAAAHQDQLREAVAKDVLIFKERQRAAAEAREATDKEAARSLPTLADSKRAVPAKTRRPRQKATKKKKT